MFRLGRYGQISVKVCVHCDPTAFDAMNLPDLAFKTSATVLGVTTLVLGADLVHAMTKEAIFGKTPVNMCLLKFCL